mgnify:CR=1 FL=1
MEKTSNVASLRDRLSKKLESDRLAVENLTQSELQKLSDALSKACSDALDTTAKGINAKTAKISKRLNEQNERISESLNSVESSAAGLAKALSRSWIKPTLIGLSLCLGIFAGSWGLMQYLAWSIEQKLEQGAALAVEIEQQEKTLAKLTAQTWGVEFTQDKSGRFLVLPPGIEPQTGYSIGQGERKQQAVRLGKP